MSALFSQASETEIPELFCRASETELAAHYQSTALTSDDLDTQMAPVHILLFVAVLFIYGRTFYTCS